MKRRTLRRTHCKRGHKLTRTNIYARKIRGTTYPECVQCMKDRVKRYRLRCWLAQQRLT